MHTCIFLMTIYPIRSEGRQVIRTSASYRQPSPRKQDVEPSSQFGTPRVRVRDPSHGTARHGGLIDSSLVARQQTNEKTLKERHASIPRARPPSPPPPRSLGPAAFYPASTLFALRSVAGISRAHGEGAKQQAAAWEYRRGERAKPKVPRPVRSASAAGSLPGGRHVVRVGAPVRRRTPHSAAGTPLITTTPARARSSQPNIPRTTGRVRRHRGRSVGSGSVPSSTSSPRALVCLRTSAPGPGCPRASPTSLSEPAGRRVVRCPLPMQTRRPHACSQFFSRRKERLDHDSRMSLVRDGRRCVVEVCRIAPLYSRVLHIYLYY
jgi:hypothetical protein